MEAVKLTEQEVHWANAMARQARQIMNPVPIFILSPYTLHRMNEQKMIHVIKGMVSDPNFVAQTGVQKDRLEMILVGVAGFELWKRGWAMRIQWVLQVVAIITGLQILWSMF